MKIPVYNFDDAHDDILTLANDYDFDFYGLSFKIRHIIGEEENSMLGYFYTDNEGYEITSKYTTIATIEIVDENDDPLFFVGNSMCVFDTPNRKTGNTIALRRAVKNFKNWLTCVNEEG